MSLVISQSKRILLPLLINEPKKWRFRREMGSFVSFFPFPPRSSPFSSFSKTNAGVAWEQIPAACTAASQPFPLLTGVRLQMVNDGISGRQGGLQRRFTVEPVSKKSSLTPSQWVTFPNPPRRAGADVNITIVLHQTLVSYQGSRRLCPPPSPAGGTMEF